MECTAPPVLHRIQLYINLKYLYLDAKVMPGSLSYTKVLSLELKNNNNATIFIFLDVGGNYSFESHSFYHGPTATVLPCRWLQVQGIIVMRELIELWV